MKKTIYTRVQAITLSLIMALMLIAACSQNNPPAPSEALPPIETLPPTPTPTPTPQIDDPNPRVIHLTGNNIDMHNIVYYDSTIYYVNHVYYSDTAIYRPHLISFDIDEMTQEELTDYTYQGKYLPDSRVFTITIKAMTADSSGNLWVYENWWDDNKSFAGIRKLDSTGVELLSIDISNTPAADILYMSSFNVDDAGNVYIHFGTGVNDIFMVIDITGKTLFSIDHFHSYHDTIRMSNGKLALTYSEFDPGWKKEILREIDVQSKSFNDIFEYDDDVIFQIFPGFEDYDFLFTDRNGILYGVNIETEDIVNLLKLGDIGVTYKRAYDGEHLDNTALLPDGRLVFTYLTGIHTGESNLFLYILSDFNPIG